MKWHKTASSTYTSGHWKIEPVYHDYSVKYRLVLFQDEIMHEAFSTLKDAKAWCEQHNDAKAAAEAASNRSLSARKTTTENYSADFPGESK